MELELVSQLSRELILMVKVVGLVASSYPIAPIQAIRFMASIRVYSAGAV